MNSQELLELRRQVAENIQKIALNGSGSPEMRLHVMLEMMRSDDVSIDIMKKAYETAQQIQDQDEKMNSMLDILYEIDRRTQDNEDDDNLDQKTEEYNQAN